MHSLRKESNTVSTKQHAGPLTGLRVIESTHIMAGPTCGLMLADMGADVIKVEQLPHGDDTRRTVPPTIKNQSAAFMMMNRNKRGIGLDLKCERGKKVFFRLVSNADILIENFRKGVMENLGFGYDNLKRINSGLIYCSLSGFGHTGPYADCGGFDFIAQGMSGLMSITGDIPTDDNTEAVPVKVGSPVTDITAGILAAMGILSAYIHRSKTGKGQQIDTSLFEAGIIHTYWQSAIFLATGLSPGPLGTAHPLMAPYQTFRTMDSWINIGAANQVNWERLLQALKAEELGRDPRFAHNSNRLRNVKDLKEILAPYFLRRTTTEWLKVFDSIDFPAGPLLSIAEMLAHPQTQARELVVEVNHSKLGRLKTLGIPVKFSETPGSVRHGAPVLGEHTREILLEHGFRSEEIDQLIAAGSVMAERSEN